MDEEQILHWLVGQLEKDEIEDVTDEMLDKMVKEGRVMAVLFCEFIFPVTSSSCSRQAIISCTKIP